MRVPPSTTAHQDSSGNHVAVWLEIEVTRREGTSKSNSVDARRRFAAKLNVAQIYFLGGKIELALDPTSRFYI